MGARVGLSRTSITNIECGRQPIQLHQLFLFASVLELSAVKLLPKPMSNRDVGSPEDRADEKQSLYLERIKEVLARTDRGTSGGDHVRQGRGQS